MNKSDINLSLEQRISYLKKLKNLIIEHRQDIYDALHKDLNKNNFEAEVSEIWPILKELKLYIKNLKKWSKNKVVNHPGKLFSKKFKLFDFLKNKRTYTVFEPYGQVLIITPWNYPFYLTFVPIINALSAGNTLLVKPSEYSSHSSELIKKICEKLFNPKHVKVFLGGKETVDKLWETQKIDFLFFTGNTKVGQILYEKAASKMIPVILELSGTNPLIIDESANLKITARKLIWSKYLNSGQTCIAPNYIAIHSKVKDEFLKVLSEQRQKLFQNSDLISKIITKQHFENVLKKFPDLKHNYESQKFDFQILETNFNDPKFDYELFCSALMLVEYSDFKDLIAKIKSRKKSLALYLFSNNKANIKYALENVKFGGGCINDVIQQVEEKDFGFGGVGLSGIGKYHGYDGFAAFSHQKNIVHYKPNKDDSKRYLTLKPSDKILKLIQKISKF
ncbi:aldehyde dehydrogenase family protein [Mycoplasmopsis synoviae]|uniref:Aldehyde dehydrogenase n=3 Tax=Mycoplasmopsis synoviae TaxID=2109 RepID=A0AAX3F2M0_MYCSY|nr:aldehyde dehydrogenase family protein [Mycoplasmopsis synoviae]QGL45229.1 aldehyde dehydrogenase family protein [Mycoplasmopsis synoviae]ULL02504.1 aldehyde dehydrogenase family protein [Mycoplasmopsis synoviae]UZW64557.1 aldehyde dehydrogenase family protein [Mycoplasmopsis synoviae]